MPFCDIRARVAGGMGVRCRPLRSKLSSWQAASASTKLAANAKRFTMGNPRKSVPSGLVPDIPAYLASLALTWAYRKRSCLSGTVTFGKRPVSRPRKSELAPDGQELVGPVVAQLLGSHVAEILEGSLDSVAGGLDGRVGLPVRAAGRLRNDPVDDPEPQEILGGDL